MDTEKVFAAIIIALIMAVAVTIVFVNENDTKMYSMGYEWVPTVQGHWEKKNAEVPK